MTVLMVTTGLLLTVAGVLSLVRLLLGSTLHDRLVAVDTLVILLVCGLVVRSAHSGEVHMLSVLVVIVLVGMLSSLAAVRLVREEDQ